MLKRANTWRTLLVGNRHKVQYKRRLYNRYVKNRLVSCTPYDDVIEMDMKRTHMLTSNKRTIVQDLLRRYVDIQIGDGYVQGQNYLMTILYFVFSKGDEKMWAIQDTFWAYVRVMSLVRPVIPDNRILFEEVQQKTKLEIIKYLDNHHPHFLPIIQHDLHTLTSLILVKWYGIWFAQYYSLNNLLNIWDQIISSNDYQHTLITITINILKKKIPMLYTIQHQGTSKMINTILEH